MSHHTTPQRDAIRSETHLLIEAGAGSGKTTTLVAKVMHALGAEVLEGEPCAQPCELAQIAAITFTEAAASDLRAALRRAIRAEARRTGDPRWRRRLYELERARIGTIHSFCGMLLREWGARAGLDPTFRIIDETEASLLRAAVARETVFDALRDGDTGATALVAELGLEATVGAIGSAMSRAALARASLERWCAGGAPQLDELERLTLQAGHAWHAHDPESARLAATALRLGCLARERLEERLAAENALDFDGLIERALELLRTRADVVRGLRARLRWLYIDEFQDTDVLQQQIAYRICDLDEEEPATAAPRLCIVGDPKQSIYRFRRADVSVWNRVAADFRDRGFDVVTLDTNFRSRAPILGLVNATFPAIMDAAFLRGEEPRHEVRYQPLRAARDYAGDDALVEILGIDPDLGADERRRAEAERIACRIREMVTGEELIRERDRDGNERLRRPGWKDVALLFRSRTRCAFYEEALRRHGIPYYLSSGGGFFARREVRDLVLLLTALADPLDDVAWAGLLRSPWIGLTDEALLRLRLPRSGPLSAAADRSGLELPAPDGPRLAAAREWLRELRFLRDRVRPSLLLERALERSGYAEYLLLQDGGELALANLKKVVRMADGGEGRSLGELVAWLRERSEIADREADARLHTAGEDVVVLTTVHGAKGLEWPVVFLCDLERGLDVGKALRPALLFDEVAGIALKRKDLDAEGEPVCGGWERLCAREAALDRAEEKRVWYVAATRARDRLVLSGCKLQPRAAEAPEEGRTPAEWLLSALQLREDGFGYAVGEDRWTGTILPEPDPAELIGPHRRRLPAAEPVQLPAHLHLRTGGCPPIRARGRHSATELMHVHSDPDGHRRSYGLGLPAPRRVRGVPEAGGTAPTGGTGNGSGGHGSVSAREIGNIVHGVLEHLRDLEDLDALLERQVLTELGEEGSVRLGPSARAELRRLIEETRTHPEIAALYACEHVEPELAFTWITGSAGAPTYLHGFIDLVGIVDGEARIVDFKSHRIQPGQEAEVAGRYHIQGAAYAAALAELSGHSAGSVAFFFPHTAGQEKLPCSAEDLALYRERIRELVRSVGG